MYDTNGWMEARMADSGEQIVFNELFPREYISLEREMEK